jgi:L-methionine (R)-S-oxide reductase
MDDTERFLIKLQDMSQFLASGSMGDHLNDRAAMTAALVGAETCSIMLINDGDGADLRLTVCAKFGPLAPAAWTTSVGKGEGIAGHVLATGRSLLVEDIESSEFAHLARRAGDPRRSLMVAPISVDAKIVGMVNACAPLGAPFTQKDLLLLDVIALFIGKSIQVDQLQTILNSRFMQLALMQEVEGRVGTAIASTAYQNPYQVARILAKSLFKEMTKAGFASAQIIGAASEIIAQLNGTLQRHSARAARIGEATAGAAPAAGSSGPAGLPPR